MFLTLFKFAAFETSKSHRTAICSSDTLKHGATSHCWKVGVQILHVIFTKEHHTTLEDAASGVVPFSA